MDSMITVLSPHYQVVIVSDCSYHLLSDHKAQLLILIPKCQSVSFILYILGNFWILWVICCTNKLWLPIISMGEYSNEEGVWATLYSVHSPILYRLYSARYYTVCNILYKNTAGCINHILCIGVCSPLGPCLYNTGASLLYRSINSLPTMDNY